ncbi:unnamed protein product, partial [Rhizoctonia solani]
PILTLGLITKSRMLQYDYLIDLTGHRANRSHLDASTSQTWCH